MISPLSVLCTLKDCFLLQAYEASHMGSRDDVQKRIEADTQRQIIEVNQLVAKNKDEVIKGLLTLVYDIEADLHKNLKMATGA